MPLRRAAPPRLSDPAPPLLSRNARRADSAPPLVSRNAPRRAAARSPWRKVGLDDIYTKPRSNRVYDPSRDFAGNRDFAGRDFAPRGLGGYPAPPNLSSGRGAYPDPAPPVRRTARTRPAPRTPATSARILREIGRPAPSGDRPKTGCCASTTASCARIFSAAETRSQTTRAAARTASDAIAADPGFAPQSGTTRPRTGDGGRGYDGGLPLDDPLPRPDTRPSDSRNPPGPPGLGDLDAPPHLQTRRAPNPRTTPRGATPVRGGNHQPAHAAVAVALTPGFCPHPNRGRPDSGEGSPGQRAFQTPKHSKRLKIYPFKPSNIQNAPVPTVPGKSAQKHAPATPDLAHNPPIIPDLFAAKPPRNARSDPPKPPPKPSDFRRFRAGFDAVFPARKRAFFPLTEEYFPLTEGIVPATEARFEIPSLFARARNEL